MGTGRMGALRAIGRTTEALQQYEAAGVEAFRRLMDSIVGADVLLDAEQSIRPAPRLPGTASSSRSMGRQF